MSRETKIGILAIVTIALSIWGYKFIKGKNILSTSQTFYIDFDNVLGLKPSTPVTVRGLQVGSVIDVYQALDQSNLVTVEIDVENHVRLPKDLTVTLTPSVMGDIAVNLIFDKQCSGPDCAQSGARFKGVGRSIFAGMFGDGEMEQSIDEMKSGMLEVVNELKKVVNDPSEENLVGNSMMRLNKVLRNMEVLTATVNKQVANDGKLDQILANVNQITSSVPSSSVEKIITDASDFTGTLKDVDMKGLSGNVDKTMVDAQTAITKLTTTLEKADVAVAKLTDLLEGIDKGEGSLGKIAKDDQLYDEIKTAAANANTLMSDIKDKPYRYMPFKRKRKVKKYDKEDAKQKALSTPTKTEELSNN